MVLVALVFSLFWFTQKPAVDPCLRQPASIDGGSQNMCRSKLGGTNIPELAINSEDWLIDRYLNEDTTTLEERKLYVSFAENSKPEDGNLFFIVELSNLRRLNTIIQNKNFVTSTSNKYKEVLTTLGKQLVTKWNIQEQTIRSSDYKSLAGVYAEFRNREKAIESFQQEKNKAFEAANQIFSDYLISNHLISANEKPAEWFHGGLGFSSDEAAISARVSRFLPAPNKLRVFSSKEVQEVLRDVLQWEKSYRESILKQFEGTNLLVKTERGVVIPHLDVFEVLRKFEDPVAVKKALVATFSNLDPVKARQLELILTPAAIEQLQIYKSLVDIYSPSLLMAERSVASLEEAVKGGMSADFAGLGALNLQAVAEALVLSKGNVNEAIKRARDSERRVTKEFKRQLSAFRGVVKQYFPNMVESGDDFVAFGNFVLSLASKHKMLDQLAEFTPDSRKRIAFLAPNAKKKDRNLIAAHGEAIEKELRLILKSKMDPDRLKKLLFGIDMVATEAGEGFVRTITGVPKSMELTSWEQNLIIQSSEEAIGRINSSADSGKKLHYKPL